MSRTARFAVDSLSGYGRLIVSGAVFFFLTPRMVETVGVPGFGLWSLIFSMVGFAGLLEAGLGVTTVRAAAARMGAEEEPLRRHEGDRELVTLGLLHALVGLVAIFVTWGLEGLVVRVFDIPPAQQGVARALVWILGLRMIILQIPLGFFRNVLYGSRRIAFVGTVQTVSVLVYGAGAWLGLSAGMGLVGLAWWNLATMLAEHAVYAWSASRVLPGLASWPRLAHRGHLRPLLGFAACTMAGNIAAQVLLRSDPLIVKMFLPLSAVALYAVAMKIAENAHLLTKQLVNVMAPLAADLHASGDGARVRSLLVDGTRVALVPALMINVAVAVCGQDVLRAWVGAELAAAAGVLVLLVTAMTLAVPQLVASTVLTMGGQEKFTAAAATASCILNVGLSVLLAPRLGLEGVALATLVTTVVVDLFLVLRRACRTVDVSAARYLSSSVWPAAWPAAAQLLLTVLLRAARPPASLVDVACIVMPGVLLHATLFWTFCVTPQEKARLGFPRSRSVAPSVAPAVGA